MNTTINRQTIEDAADLADVEVYEGYSGRGMYGDTCFGVTGESTDRFLLNLAYALGYADAETGSDEGSVQVAKLARAARHDNLGLDMILYFPGFELDN